MDITSALLTFSHAPNKKGKVLLFRDMTCIRIDHSDKDPYGDKDYPYAFVLQTVSRDYFFGCSTRVEREMWVNGFNVLFEYREKT